ncbi:hypothetical protein [Enterocloster citroniae]
MTRTNKNRLVLLLGYVVLITGCLLVLLPLSWMVITSLKSMTDITLSRGLKLFPSGPTLENFVNIWKEYPIATYIKNSAIAVGDPPYSALYARLCADTDCPDMNLRARPCCSAFCWSPRCFRQ